MCVMVLHGEGRYLPSLRQLCGQAGAEEIRMQIMRHGLRLAAGELHEMRDGGLQRETIYARSVSPLYCEKRLVATRDAQRVLEEAAQGQYRRLRLLLRKTHVQRTRRVTA